MTRPPFLVTLPWAVVCRDNARHGLLQRQGGAARIRLTGQYRRALEFASMAAMAGRKGQPPFAEPVALTITLHEPDGRRRDIGNYVKLIADALTGSAYVDDHCVDDLRVIRGAKDPSKPRAEIEVAALPHSPVSPCLNPAVPPKRNAWQKSQHG